MPDGYTLANLREIESSAPGDVGLESRLARHAIDSEHLGVSLFSYEPGVRHPFGHRHREQEECYVVVAGSGRAKLDDEIVELRRWDVVRVAPETARALEAGPDGLEVVIVATDRPDGDDGVGVENFWPE